MKQQLLQRRVRVIMCDLCNYSLIYKDLYNQVNKNKIFFPPLLPVLGDGGRGGGYFFFGFWYAGEIYLY